MQIPCQERVVIQGVPGQEMDIATATMDKGYMASALKFETEASGSIPARLLKDKMIGALDRLGYNLNDQEKVARLLDRNIRTVHHELEHDHNLVHEMDGIQKSLFQLLYRFASFNTNEPLLMITKNNILRDGNTGIDAFVSEVMYQLRLEYNIKPVRVAVLAEGVANVAGLPVSAETEPAYSLTLLNVVNTDIGGPSMIQLFDDEYCSMEWLHCVAWVEAWHDQDRLWRVQSEGNFDPHGHFLMTDVAQLPKDVLTEVIDLGHEIDEQEAGVDSFSDNRGHDILGNSMEDQATSGTFLDDSDVESVHPAEITGLPADHPAFIELRAREQEERQIIHPTWKHVNTSESLADLVRLQASQLSFSSSDTDLVAITAETVSAKSASEDGFEIV